MKKTLWPAIALGVVTLTSCQSAGNLVPPNLSKASSGEIVGFDDLKYKALVERSGRKFQSQKACMLDLDKNLADLLLAENGTLYMGVTNITMQADIRSFNYSGHFNYCGVLPPPEQPNNICRVPAPDTFKCSDAVMHYQRAQVPPSAFPPR